VRVRGILIEPVNTQLFRQRVKDIPPNPPVQIVDQDTIDQLDPHILTSLIYLNLYLCIFTDGACVYQGDEMLALAAWSAVMTSHTDQPGLNTSGALTGAQQTSYLAELQAAVSALQKYHVDIHLFIDNESVCLYLHHVWMARNGDQEAPFADCCLEQDAIDIGLKRTHNWKVQWIKGHSEDLPSDSPYRCWPEEYFL
jgi:ribonuclease HI